MDNFTTTVDPDAAVCGKNYKDDGFTRSNLNVWGLVGLIIFYVIILSMGIVISWYKRSVGERDSDRAIVAGREIGLGVGIITLTATWVGGGYINGTAEYTYTPGTGVVWTQAPWGYSVSLILGGLFFAKKMREREYTTMLEPFQEKYGRVMTALCFIPALTAETFWSAAILSALGTSLTVIVGLSNEWAVITSAIVVVLYTLAGGLFSVAYTDIIQLGCIFVGLWLAIPFALTHDAVKSISKTAYSDDVGWVGTDNLTDDAWLMHYIDNGFLLIFGGIPWQAYFQRVLSQKNPKYTPILSVTAGIGCFLMAIPAVIIGAIGASTDWKNTDYADDGCLPIKDDDYKLILPLVMQYLTPTWVASIGLGAVSAAVMSSADSSTLSASSLFTVNVYKPLREAFADVACKGKQVSDREIMWVLRASIVCVATLSCIVALEVNSVYGLFYLCGDFVYVLLFPQLTLVLYYQRGNAYGALCGYVIGAIIRFTGGEPLLSMDAVIKYPYYDDETEIQRFPFKTMAMVITFVSIIVFSELAILINKCLESRGCENEKWDFFGAFSEKHMNEAVLRKQRYVTDNTENSFVMDLRDSNGVHNLGFSVKSPE